MMDISSITNECKRKFGQADQPEIQEAEMHETAAEHEAELSKANENWKEKFDALLDIERFRNFLMMVAAALVGVTGVIAVSLSYLGHRTAGFIVGLVALFLLIVAVALFFLMKAEYSKETVELEAATRTKDLLEGVTAEDDPCATFLRNLVNITLENQEKNYKLVHTQADKSFWATLAVSIAGFLLIGVGVYYGSRSTTNAAAYVGAICGSITEFIAGVFFWLYQRTVTQLRQYHDSLISLQNTILCLQLVQQTEEQKRPQLLEKVIDSLLIGLKAKPRQESEQTSQQHNGLKGSLDVIPALSQL